MKEYVALSLETHLFFRKDYEGTFFIFARQFSNKGKQNLYNVQIVSEKNLKMDLERQYNLQMVL